MALLMVAMLCCFMSTAKANSNVQLSAPVILTEWTDQAGIYPFVNASTPAGVPVGAWSVASDQQMIIRNGFVYEVSCSLLGAGKVKKLYLTPNHGITMWEFTQKPMVGFVMTLPTLPEGRITALEVIAQVQDKKKRLIFVVIPINWTDQRNLSTGIHVMTQVGPKISGHCLPWKRLIT
jgi:hypothetical protein